MAFHIERVMSKSYATYRGTPVGKAMFESLLELLEEDLITEELAVMVVHQFDFSIRKLMANAYGPDSEFFFDGQYVASRMVDDVYHMVFRDVWFFQHFSPRTIQNFDAQASWYGWKSRMRSKKPVSTTQFSLFLKRLEDYNVSVFVERVPEMLMICSTPRKRKNARGFYVHPVWDKCTIEDNHSFNINPRVEFIALKQMGTLEEVQANVVEENDNNDDNVIPAPLLSRFRNSSMFQVCSVAILFKAIFGH